MQSLVCIIDEALKRYIRLITYILAVFLPMSFETMFSMGILAIYRYIICSKGIVFKMTYHVMFYRKAFQRLVSPMNCSIRRLKLGEAYAKQNASRTDRLSLLLAGR